jgi:coatomer protein complex subunit alpha (xenin)
MSFFAFLSCLQGCGQLSLAYLTAATHGLNEEAQLIGEHMDEDQVSKVKPRPSARLLRPSPPLIQSESNWPLLTVSKVNLSTYSTT